MNNIGFGCSRLTSNLTEKHALRNLEVAYDNGITHFDVARLYGYGLAEGIVGKFARGKRNKITITTKVGLFPNNNNFLKNLFLQNSARYLYRLIKKSKASKHIQQKAGQAVFKTFNLQDIKVSLETSLKELKTDYIDYFLLHEADVAEANNEEIINFMEKQKAKGIIKAYGIGTYSDILENTFPLLDKKYTVLQTNNSFPGGIPQTLIDAEHIEKRFYFSPMHHFVGVKRLWDADAKLSSKISHLLDYDFQNSLIDLFLIQQFYNTAGGTFLFSTNKEKNIKNIVERWLFLKSITPGCFQHFADVRTIVNEKLLYAINSQSLSYAKND